MNSSICSEVKQASRKVRAQPIPQRQPSLTRKWYVTHTVLFGGILSLYYFALFSGLRAK